jgi:hypothetical protein
MATKFKNGITIDGGNIDTASGQVYKINGTTVLSSTQVLGKGVTDANTASAIVARDGSGNFSAGTVTANLTGNATGVAAASSSSGTAISSSNKAIDAGSIGTGTPGIYAIPPSAVAGTNTTLTSGNTTGCRFWVSQPITITKAYFNITANAITYTTGTLPSVTIAIFSADGATRLVSSSAFALNGIGTGIKTVTLSSTTLNAGTSYQMAIWHTLGGGGGSVTISTINTLTDLFLDTTSQATRVKTQIGYFVNTQFSMTSNLATVGGSFSALTTALPLIGLQPATV